MLQFREELKQVPSQRGECVRGVAWRESSDEPDGDQSYLGGFVVEGDEQRSKRIRLAQVRIRGGARPAERRQHSLAHTRVEVTDRDGE